ncbi:5-formyltetrahydrofolate cyclo-ligase [Aeromicrobium panaciterrae]|uniref:5-formyltetrahydrofolate cyclo-ligase n=1 Tax=Aeromicrobium panaciterrae TaxID=363861 RepID=A0ABU1ULL0_9ACTN|nr:5-formyltetrahydrofolate cyclo-ligase [Aeromicrobium panaciterrae]MDR7086056.1 5-formyltetrahydrofolate cyclo-ligase [Aeromicrobium panaciterrae]
MTKDELRTDLLRRRREMSDDVRAEAAEAIALHVLAAPIISSARRVACYLSMATEPGTAPLIERLLARGIEVIVPLSLADGTLDWAVYDPAATTTVTTLGIAEPEGSSLGSAAIEDCALIFVPALAVDHAGMRLGRGAGYYDRALAGTTRPTCAVVFAHELIESVPHEPHDVPVNMAVTPNGIFHVPE